MKPIDFKQANTIFTSEENDVRPLSAYVDNQQHVSCWRLSLWDRVCAVLFGRVWLSVRTGSALPPVWLRCERSAFK